MPATSKIKQRAKASGLSVEALILDALNNTDTAIEAAELLGVRYITLWQYMQRYNIQKTVIYSVEAKPDDNQQHA